MALLLSAACDTEESREPLAQEGGESTSEGGAAFGAGGQSGEGGRGAAGRGAAGRGAGSSGGAALDSGTQGAPDAAADAAGAEAEPDPDAGPARQPEAGDFDCPDGTICPEVCAEGHVPVPTESECHEMGPACYPLLDGSYCLAPQIDPCPPGFRSLPPGEPCVEQGCYQYSNDVSCTPAD
jgi:hypothetical protein